jgi:NitT/TauT family transport system substrate-binding protein
MLSAAAAVTLAGAIGALAQDLQNLTLRLAFTAGGIDAPFFVALEKGYFAEEGINLEILDGNGSTSTIQAVGNGTVQIGNASLAALVQASAAAGFDNITSVFGLVQKDPSSIISLAGSGIKEPKDIEGKRYATSPRNLTDGMVQAFAEANGVDFSTVKVIVIESYQTALLRGDADFINTWAHPNGDQIREHADIEEPIMLADHGINLLGTSVIVRKEWLAKNEDLMRGYLRAIVRGHADVQADPAEALEIFIKHRPDASRDAIAREIKVMEQFRHTARSAGMPFGHIHRDDLLQTIGLMERYSDVAPGVVTPDMVYTDAYLPATE